MVFVHEQLNVPANVFTTNMGEFKPQRLTNMNPSFENMAHGKTDIIRWRSTDGLVMGVINIQSIIEKVKRCLWY